MKTRFKYLICSSIFLLICVNVHIVNSKQKEMKSIFFDLESLAAGEGSGTGESGDKYACTVTTNCYNLIGQVDGSVSCTGTKCDRGAGWSGERWVECDGHRTAC